MNLENGLMLVLSNPTAGDDDEFNEWYDSTHVPEVLSVPGVVAAKRYDLAPIETPEVEGMEAPAPPAHRYLAVYELDRDGNEVMGDLVGRILSGEMTMSETLDMSTVGLSVWRPRP